MKNEMKNVFMNEENARMSNEVIESCYFLRPTFPHKSSFTRSPNGLNRDQVKFSFDNLTSQNGSAHGRLE